jgi:hypothetical protein
MSWSISTQGTPGEVMDSIGTLSESLTGQSKIEFDHVKEHLAKLVGQNYRGDAPGFPARVILRASGSGSFRDGPRGPELLGSSCAVSIEPVYNPATC